MFNDFITIDFLYTFGGLLVVLGLIIQFTKGLLKQYFDDVAVRWYTFAWAFALILIVYWSQGLFDAAGREIWMTLVLALLNAIILTLSALGGYEVLSDPKATKQKL